MRKARTATRWSASLSKRKSDFAHDALDFLGLPGLKTTLKAETAETIEVEAEATEPRFAPCCLFADLRKDGHRPNRRLVNDTPHGGKAVLVRLKVHRAKCVACGKKGIAEVLPHLRHDRHMTQRCFEHIARQCLRSTNSEVGREVHVSEGTARSILGQYLAEHMAQIERTTPRVLGLDEKTILRKPRAVLGDVENRKLLDVLPNRDWALVAFLEGLPDRERVEVFCTDMYPPYRQLWRRHLSHAAHVTDKFHVVRRANLAVDKVRAAYAATLEGRERTELRNAKRLFGMRAGDMPDWARDRLREWSLRHPVLSEAYWTKERFFELYEVCHTPTEAEHYYRHWVQTLPAQVKAVFKKHCSIQPFWMPTVLAYFDHPYTTGYIESVNRVIDDIHRAGRGYSFDVIRGKLLLAPALEAKSFRRRAGIWLLAIIRCSGAGRVTTRPATIRYEYPENRPPA